MGDGRCTGHVHVHAEYLQKKLVPPGGVSGQRETPLATRLLAAYVRARAEPVRPSMEVHRVVIFSVKEGFDTATRSHNYRFTGLQMLTSRSFWPLRLYGRRWRYTDNAKSSQALEAKLLEGGELAKKLLEVSNTAATENDATHQNNDDRANEASGQPHPDPLTDSTTPARPNKRSRQQVSPGDSAPEQNVMTLELRATGILPVHFERCAFACFAWCLSCCLLQLCGFVVTVSCIVGIRSVFVLCGLHYCLYVTLE